MFYTVHMKTKADLFTRPYALRISDEDHARMLRLSKQTKAVSNAEVFREALKVYEVHLKQKES